MTTFTEHYGLKQPEETDGYDIGEMNENMATIDAAMAAQEESMGEMNEKMGTAADTGTETIFGKLNQIAENTAGGGQGLTAIKSIQHHTYQLENVNSESYAITPVDPTKCIVLFERLYDANEATAKAVYELKANSVTFTCGNFRSSFTIGLWIIEFM